MLRIENNPVDYFLDAFEKCYPDVAAKIRGIYLDFDLVKSDKVQSRTIYNEYEDTRFIFICPVTAKGRNLSYIETIDLLANELALAIHGGALDHSALQFVKKKINDRIAEEVVNKMMELH